MPNKILEAAVRSQEKARKQVRVEESVADDVRKFNKLLGGRGLETKKRRGRRFRKESLNSRLQDIGIPAEVISDLVALDKKALGIRGTVDLQDEYLAVLNKHGLSDRQSEIDTIIDDADDSFESRRPRRSRQEGLNRDEIIADVFADNVADADKFLQLVDSGSFQQAYDHLVSSQGCCGYSDWAGIFGYPTGTTLPPEVKLHSPCVDGDNYGEFSDDVSLTL